MLKKISNILAFLRFFLVSFFCNTRVKAYGRNYFQNGSLNLAKAARFELKEKNVFDRCFDIEVVGQLTVGSRNYFNKNVRIVCLGQIEIGDDCLIADSVHIYDHDHRHDDISRTIGSQGYVTAPVKIGNNVWLGAKVTVLKGVTIGDGVIVGANSLVSKDLPSNSICGGVPAKVIKMRQKSDKTSPTFIK